MRHPYPARLRAQLTPTVEPASADDPLVAAFRAHASVTECRRQALLLGFESAGFAVLTAPSGNRLVSELLSCPEHPSVVLQLFDSYYGLTTRWSGHQALLTLSSRTPRVREHTKLVVQKGSGAGLARDLARHLRTAKEVAPDLSSVLHFESLERECERELAHYRHATPLTHLLRYFGHTRPWSWIRSGARALSTGVVALLGGLLLRASLMGASVMGVALLFCALAAFSGPDKAQERMERLGLGANELLERDFAEALAAGAQKLERDTPRA